MSPGRRSTFILSLCFDIMACEADRVFLKLWGNIALYPRNWQQGLGDGNERYMVVMVLACCSICFFALYVNRCVGLLGLLLYN